MEVKSVENIIEVKNLCKSFGKIKAINNLNFCLKKGELFAFLGENGAGKSTTISIICGSLKKDKGTVFINGKDITQDANLIKSDLGVVFQNSTLDKFLSVRDNLQSRAALYGICGTKFKKRIKELAELLEFSDLLNRTVGKLSGGQRRRIDIARALIHKPKILILDEPTTGLDPQTRKKVWDVITKLQKDDNMTVFLTTHYMEEASVADYVVILNEGQVVANGTPLELKNQYAGDFITIYNIEEEKIKNLNLDYEKIRDGYQILVPNTTFATNLILKYSEIFIDYEITKGKMDDVFLSVTGKKLTIGENK